MAAVRYESYGYYGGPPAYYGGGGGTMAAAMVTASGVPHYRGHPLAGW